MIAFSGLPNLLMSEFVTTKDFKKNKVFFFFFSLSDTLTISQWSMQGKPAGDSKAEKGLSTLNVD